MTIFFAILALLGGGFAIFVLMKNKKLEADMLRVQSEGLNAAFTLVAEAHEYRETKALEKMTPEEREKYHLRRANGEDLVAE